jgi:3D (Asp-Asp-Asp) domain-containing protein
VSTYFPGKLNHPWESGGIVYHTHNLAFIYGVPEPGTTSGYNWGVYQEGTGYTADGKYISLDYNHQTEDGRAVFVYEKGGACKASGYEIESERTVAANLNFWQCGDKFMVERYGDTIFTVADSGSDLNQYQLDIFVGPMTKAEFDARFSDPGSTHFYAKVAKVK